jgi:hypothetical protein
LRRCLGAIATQTRQADQVIIVARFDDFQTWTMLRSLATSGCVFTTVAVDRPGVVHALNSGLRIVSGDIVAITDDDAAPRAEWLERIEKTFQSNPKVGGVGGRDLIHGPSADATELRHLVGKVQWFGRVIGNHHVGCGPARPVDVLKGVNCAYRTAALSQCGFEERLRGLGAQVHFELAIGLALTARGWTLVYDPTILVDHYPAQRHDCDQRGIFNSQALSDEVHNEMLVLLRHLPPGRRAIFIAWSLLCGTRSYPGVLCCLVEAARRQTNTFARFTASLRGRAQGLGSWIGDRDWRALNVSKRARPITTR